MPRPSRKAIFDASTCDSSMDGCDGDWRAEVFAWARPRDVAEVRAVLAQHTEAESRLELSRKEGK